MEFLQAKRDKSIRLLLVMISHLSRLYSILRNDTVLSCFTHLRQGSLKLLNLFLLYRLGSRSKECLRHDRRMMVTNLPLSILPHIHKGVPSLDLITSSSHCKLINSNIRANIVTDGNTALQNLTLWLLR